MPQLGQDKFTLVLLFGLPLFLWALVVGIFYKELPTKLNIGIVDLDHSHLSLEIKSALNAHSRLRILHFYPSLNQAKGDLASKVVYAVVVLPSGLERRTKLGVKTPIALYYNAEFVLVGKAISGAFLQTLMTLNVKNDVIMNLAVQSNLNIAKALAFPVHAKIHPLYNEDSNYAQFLLGVILPCMWQILAAVGMLNLLEKSRNFKEILGAFACNTAIFSLWGILMLGSLQPHYTHLGLLLAGIVLMVLGISSVALSLYAILGDPIKVASALAAYTAPSLAFVGVTYPASNMSTLGAFWGSLLPVSYFIKIFIALGHYSDGLILAKEYLLKLPFFLLFLPLGLGVAYLKARKACTPF
ncbi:ABC transporter permease [Helicobacter cynogastricus]|uniref:ABC transporter permease n=1 Tax=Helicobacter cynogastricus TaxID=329937 RepID=UPI000CF1C436|nr:ABC transporter permease [Helicobacter cynogastricus]